jgi:hypothetical protein
MKKSLIIASIIIVFFTLQSSVNNGNYHRFPPTNCTGAPNAYTCGFCHSDFASNMAGGGVSLIGIPATIVKGGTYSFSINIHHFAIDRKKFGYDIGAFDANGYKIGTLGSTNPYSILGDSEITSNNPPILTATDYDSIGGFTWTAPDSLLTPDRLPITFYFCGNACNYDGKPNGDYIYNDSVKTTLGLLPINNNRLSLQYSNNGSLQLNWKFSNNSFVKYYVIQKSTDNSHFKNIDSISPTQQFSCTFIDKKVDENSSSFYRIMSIDMFGFTSYSNIERYSPKAISNNNEVFVFPNPIEKLKMLNVNIQSSINQIGNISIVNNAGKLIYQTKIDLLKGANSYQLAIDNRYTFGMYHLIYQSNTQVKKDCRFLVK